MHLSRAMLLPSRVAALLLLATCISTRASDVPRPKLRVPPALVINLPRDADIGTFVTKQVQTRPHVRDTFTFLGGLINE